MLRLLEDKNLYTIDEVNQNIIVMQNIGILHKNKDKKVKIFKDKYKNTFRITLFNNNKFYVDNIKIRQIDLIQDIVTTAIEGYNSNEYQNIFLFMLSFNLSKNLNYDFGSLIVKFKIDTYNNNISIYDKTRPGYSTLFKLCNNITLYTNLQIEKIQLNKNLVVEFKDFEKLRYLQISDKKVFIYLPVNDMYKQKLFTVINRLMDEYV